jgi:hypothetical protein
LRIDKKGTLLFYRFLIITLIGIVELEIGDNLFMQGIDSEDIIFGFIPENERDLVRLTV